MSRLILRGAYIRFVDIRPGAAGVVTKLNMTSDFTDVVRNEMGWGEPPDGWDNGGLEGELAASHAILTPNDKTLRQSNELQMDVLKVDKFQYVRTTDHDANTTSQELRFIIHTAMEGAAALAESYLRAVGDKVAQLRISYQPEPEQLPLGEDSGAAAQPSLDGAAVEQPDGPCVDCNNGVPLQDGDPTMHASGQPCVAYEGHAEGAALAPAARMGGTHQSKRRGRGQIVDTTGTPVN